MRVERLFGILFGLLIVVFGVLWIWGPRVAEAFQTADPIDPVEIVMNPSETDIFKVTVPRGMAVWALKTFSGTPAEIRARILADYTATVQQYNTASGVQAARNAAWTANPKQKTCEELQGLATRFRAMVDQMRSSVGGVSGALATGINYKDLNLDAQKGVQDRCRDLLAGEGQAGVNQLMVDACRNLAKQDDTLVTLIPFYEMPNTELLNLDLEFTERYTLVTKLLSFLQCPNSTFEPGLSKDQAAGGVGLVDVELFKRKLQELSPYYISPVSLSYISKLLSGKMEDSLSTVPELKNTVDSNVSRINRLL
jgi:hypothetical protein